MDGFAIGGNRGQFHHAAIIFARSRFQHAPRSTRGRFAISAFSIIDAQSDIFDAVSMQPDMLGYLALRAKRRGEDKAHIALLQDITAAITQACL